VNNVLVVGDIHGSWGYLNKLINRKQPDIVLQVGDFGWWPHFHNKRGLLPKRELFKQFGIKNKLSNGKYCQVYWIPGNHENTNDLRCTTKDYEPVEIQDGVTYCPFGTVLNINDQNILCCGGAESTDKHHRIEGVSWWKSEIISQEDMDHLPSTKYKIDIVLSHTIPRSFFPQVERIFNSL